ncbi:MAG: hypothetical protein U1A77_06605 [Pirellulales bacterium]
MTSTRVVVIEAATVAQREGASAPIIDVCSLVGVCLDRLDAPYEDSSTDWKSVVPER